MVLTLLSGSFNGSPISIHIFYKEKIAFPDIGAQTSLHAYAINCWYAKNLCDLNNIVAIFIACIEYFRF